MQEDEAMKTILLTLIALFAVACTQQDEAPNCEQRYIRSEPVGYQVVCDGDIINTIERTEEAMTEACGPRGWLEGEDWQCEGWLVTTYSDEYIECDCAPQL